MIVEQRKWSKKYSSVVGKPENIGNKAQLVLCFGSREKIEDENILKLIRKKYPKSIIFGCSTAGEIIEDQVLNNSLVTTAIYFENTEIEVKKQKILNPKESFSVGAKLAKSIKQKGLRHIFVLSDGLNVNGSELIEGLSSCLPEKTAITGGLAGDGYDFKKTSIIFNEKAEKNTVAILGFYGDKIQIGYGSRGGWDSFGPEKLISKSDGNILYELDGKPALDIYKRYLGKYAKDLPASGLLFPLGIRGKNRRGVIRGILKINEKDKSVHYGGGIPEGAYARFMKVNFDRLIDGAIDAAKINLKINKKPKLAILISCLARKEALKQRVEEEVEGIKNVFGKNTKTIGFYSYGEIAPFSKGNECELHNYTMTITTFSES